MDFLCSVRCGCYTAGCCGSREPLATGWLLPQTELESVHSTNTRPARRTTCAILVNSCSRSFASPFLAPGDAARLLITRVARHSCSAARKEPGPEPILAFSFRGSVVSQSRCALRRTSTRRGRPSSPIPIRLTSGSQQRLWNLGPIDVRPPRRGSGRSE